MADEKQGIWLVVGKEIKDNHIEHILLKEASGQRQTLTPLQFQKFSHTHNIINVRANGEQMVGNGISLRQLPTYQKNKNGTLYQVGGLQEQQLVQICLPMIDQYKQKKQFKQEQAELREHNELSIKLDKLIDRLQTIYFILNCCKSMKQLTNDIVTKDPNICKYIKLIDMNNLTGTDNSIVDSLGSRIQRYGVNGLLNGIENQLQTLLDRAERQGILYKPIMTDKGATKIDNYISYLLTMLEEVRKKHHITKEIIGENSINKQIQKEEQKKGTPVTLRSPPIQVQEQSSEQAKLSKLDSFMGLDTPKKNKPVTLNKEEQQVDINKIARQKQPKEKKKYLDAFMNI